MAEIEEVIVTKLTAHVGLSALIGARLYPLTLPQRPTLPAVTYQRISTKTEPTRDEPHASLERPRFQFDIWGASYASARAVAQQLRVALPMLAQASNPRVDVALLQDDQDAYEAETERWRAILDVFIWHQEN